MEEKSKGKAREEVKIGGEGAANRVPGYPSLFPDRCNSGRVHCPVEER